MSGGLHTHPDGTGEAFRLTERDLGILVWVARFRIASHEHICQRFEGGPEGLRKRLRLLTAAGLLERHQVLAGRPSVFVTTRLGLDVCDSALPAATLDLRTYLHDMELTTLACRLEVSGLRVTSEREMRSAEQMGAAGYSVAIQTPQHGRTGTRHYPDLIVHRDEGDAADQRGALPLLARVAGAVGVSVVEVATNAGHSPTMTLDTYAHVMAEFDPADRRTAEEHIAAARERHLRQFYDDPASCTDRKPIGQLKNPVRAGVFTEALYRI